MPDNFLSLIKCMFQNHKSKQIIWICLSRCRSNIQRKVCEICITDKHLDHQCECLHTEHLVLILENNRKKIVKFLNNISEIPISDDLRDNIKQLKTEMSQLIDLPGNQALFFMKKSTKILCQNNQEQKLNTDILDSIFDVDDNDFLISNYIAIGDSLKKSNNTQLALQYYDRAMSLSLRDDDKLSILARKYNILISSEKIDEASLMLTQMNQIGTHEDPIKIMRQIVYDQINRFFGLIKQRPQLYDIIKPLASRAMHVKNPILLEAMMLFCFRPYDKALKLAELINRQDTDYNTAIEIQILCLLRMKKFEEPLKIINQELEIQSDNSAFIFWKQILLFFIGKKHESNIQSPQLIFLQSLTKGLMLTRCDKMNEALDEFNQALIIYPNQELALYLKGMMLVHFERLEEANILFDQINLDKNDPLQALPPYYVYERNMLNQMKFYQKMRNFFLTFYHMILSKSLLDWKNEINIFLGANLYDQEKYEMAFSTVQILNPYEKQSPQIATYLGENFILSQAATLMELRRFQEALVHISNALVWISQKEFYNETYILHYIKGCILFELGRQENIDYQQQIQYIDQAFSSFNLALQNNSEFQKINYCLGLTLLYQKKYKQAIPYLHAYVILNNDSLSTIYNIGIALFYTQQYEQAKEKFQQVQIYKKSLLYLTITLFQLREYKEAHLLLDQYMQTVEPNYQIQNLKALCLIGLEEYQTALQTIEISLEHFGGNMKIYLCKAFILYCLHQYPESEVEIDKALQMRNEKTLNSVYLLNALILPKLGKFNDALQFLDHLLQSLSNEKIHIYDYSIISRLKSNLIEMQLDNEAQVPSWNETNILQSLADEKGFLLKYILQEIETMQIQYEDIKRRKSKFDIWLLNVDGKACITDFGDLFNYVQKKVKK